MDRNGPHWTFHGAYKLEMMIDDPFVRYVLVGVVALLVLVAWRCFRAQAG